MATWVLLALHRSCFLCLIMQGSSIVDMCLHGGLELDRLSSKPSQSCWRNCSEGFLTLKQSKIQPTSVLAVCTILAPGLR